MTPETITALKANNFPIENPSLEELIDECFPYIKALEFKDNGGGRIPFWVVISRKGTHDKFPRQRIVHTELKEGVALLWLATRTTIKEHHKERSPRYNLNNIAQFHS